MQSSHRRRSCLACAEPRSSDGLLPRQTRSRTTQSETERAIPICMSETYRCYRLKFGGIRPLRRRHSLPLTLQCRGQRVILAVISNHSLRTQWSFTLPTRRAPVQPARPTTCSRKAKTSPATGAPGNGGLALLGSAWQASLPRRTGYSTQAPASAIQTPCLN
jgi:hypothetical protein